VNRVRFFDPRRAYDAQREQIDAAIRRVLESEQIVLGPEVEAFEREFAEATETTETVRRSRLIRKAQPTPARRRRRPWSRSISTGVRRRSTS
jgi:DegT/DnrJ/EryC1/StrS aminotransferase family